MARKSPAADRTVDMFSGLTREQEAKEAVHNAKEAIQAEDIQGETSKPAETIEQAADRWRDNAFAVTEHVSKSFGKGMVNQGVYRLTARNGWLFLEQQRLGKDGMAFHWAGIMFPGSDLYELTSVFVKAAKERKSREAMSAEGAKEAKENGQGS